jgi:glycosyltransferase involved in cell wall biosynthesis
MIPQISVIVATYNRPDALDAVLRSLSAQTDRHFEVIVADDGSDAATAAVVTRWSRQMGAPVKHAWHPDEGFRLAEIRNRAIRISGGEYCVFLDGDCIVRPDFIARHRALMEPGWFVAGSRVLLAAEFTGSVLAGKIAIENDGFRQWLPRRRHGEVNRVLPLLRLPLGPLRKLTPRRWRGGRGCNMAFWRADLDAVDGFDGAFSGWGREDTDMFIRMIRNGVRRKSGSFATAVLHLWHKEADRARLGENDRQIAALRAEARVRAKRGLSQIVTEIVLSRPQSRRAS